MCMRLRHMQLHGNAQSIPNPKYWGVVYASYNVGGVTTMDLLTSLNIIIQNIKSTIKSNYAQQINFLELLTDKEIN